MKLRWTQPLLVGAGLLFLAACNSIDSRIAKMPEVYASLNATERANIEAGRIDLNYTPDMVYLALGDPTRVGTKITDEANVEIWRYQGIRFNDPYWYDKRFYCGPWGSPYWRSYYSRYGYGPWGAYPQARTERYDRLVVEFTDGKVSSIFFPDARRYEEPIRDDTGPIATEA